MEIPITIATVVAIDAPTCNVLALETFIFFGVPTSEDCDSVNECAGDMAHDHSAFITEDTIDEALDTGYYGTDATIRYDDGAVIIKWVQRL